ncbi:rootletin-like [Carcharodon carcharias]|uniref:rootletin-like n=1 Tax=Carcharodon carcharias TaxID=13397 RepID=UPI001B7E8BDD|nr:rootletin-like [Carcharodon carcharias]
MANPDPLREEVGVLERELARVEDHLALTKAERDELAIKYSAVCERLEQSLMKEEGDEVVSGSPEGSEAARVNAGLRRQLEEEQIAYKRKLQTYQEGQQRQALLVQKLQGKPPPASQPAGTSSPTYQQLQRSDSLKIKPCEYYLLL